MKGVLLALLALLASLGLAAVQAHAGEEAGWQPVQLPHSSQRDLHSQRTGKDYRIFVSEPRHAPPPGGYPVLYVLDGNALDRKSVGSGKSVSVRVDLGGRRIINKKKKQQNKKEH